MYTINDNHMLYGSENTKWTKENFFPFWGNFCHFTPHNKPEKIKFWKNERNIWWYYNFTHVYYKWQSHDVWFLRYGAWRKTFLSFWTFFLLRYTRINPKYTPQGNILQKCTKSHDHILHCSWDTLHGRCSSYFLFWAILCPFTLLTTQKIKIF